MRALQSERLFLPPAIYSFLPCLERRLGLHRAPALLSQLPPPPLHPLTPRSAAPPVARFLQPSHLGLAGDVRPTLCPRISGVTPGFPDLSRRKAAEAITSQLVTTTSPSHHCTFSPDKSPLLVRQPGPARVQPHRSQFPSHPQGAAGPGCTL